MDLRHRLHILKRRTGNENQEYNIGFHTRSTCLAACSLQEYPYGFYSEDNFYQTAADAEAAVNYIYDAITYIEYSRAIVFLGDMNTDALTPKGDATAATKELDTWNLNNFKTNTTLANFYKYSYITINRANAVIAKVPGMKTLEQRDKDRYVGEAYFMRGYSYFCLARNFGCVPVHLNLVSTIEDTAAARREEPGRALEGHHRQTSRPSACFRTIRPRSPAAWTRLPHRACWPRRACIWHRPRITACPSTPT